MVSAVTLPSLQENGLLRLQLRRQRQAVHGTAARFESIDLPAQRDHVRVILIVRRELPRVLRLQLCQQTLVGAGVARLLELLLEEDLILLQHADLLADIVQIALRAVHEV